MHILALVPENQRKRYSIYDLSRSFKVYGEDCLVENIVLNTPKIHHLTSMAAIMEEQ